MAPTPEPRHWHELPNAPPRGAALGSLQTLADGEPLLQALPLVPGADKPFRVLLLRSGAQVQAFVNRCAHFGVPLAERQDLLIYKAHISISCNVHYARYRWSDGLCIAGDCEGESLLPIPVVVDANGCICIAMEQ